MENSRNWFEEYKKLEEEFEEYEKPERVALRTRSSLCL